MRPRAAEKLIAARSNEMREKSDDNLLILPFDRCAFQFSRSQRHHVPRQSVIIQNMIRAYQFKLIQQYFYELNPLLPGTALVIFLSLCASRFRLNLSPLFAPDRRLISLFGLSKHVESKSNALQTRRGCTLCRSSGIYGVFFHSTQLKPFI